MGLDAFEAVNRVVPMVHAEDVQKSADFYALLGFTVGNSLRGLDGNLQWAWLACGDAAIMLARSSGAIVPEQQAILLYLYSRDVHSLRKHLLASGLQDGGRFTGCPGPGDGRRVAFEATFPEYMPRGEIRVADPDGYCLLIGQP